MAHNPAGPSAEPADVLTFGPPIQRWPWRRRSLILVLAVCLVLLAAGLLLSRWLAASSPTFSRDEVAEVYRSLPDIPGGSYAWDMDSVTSTDTAPDPPAPTRARGVCDEFAAINSPPSSIDVAAVYFGKRQRAGDIEPSGRMSTSRYNEPSAARVKLQAINRMLQQCPVLTVDGESLKVDQVSTGPDSRGRSATSFRVSLPDQRDRLRVQIVRFGNTITWMFDDESGLSTNAAVPDALADRMLQVHRRRR